MQNTQTASTQVGFYKPHQLPDILDCGKAHIYRLLDQGEIPPPEYDELGRIIGYPVDEVNKIVKARELNLPKATRLQIVKKMAAKRKIDYSALADQFLNTVH